MQDDVALPTEGEAAPCAVTAPVAFGSGALALIRRGLPVVVLLIALLALWEGSKLLFGISDNKLPHLSAVIGIFGTRTQGGEGPLFLTQMLTNAASTFGVASGGFILGSVLGFLLALLFTQMRLLERSFMPYVIGSQAVPILAIAPMVVVGMGRMGSPDWLAKAVVAAYLTFFPVTIGALRGLSAASPEAVALMRSYSATPAQTFLKLRFPASLPYLFTSLKVAATASVIGAIVAELPSGSRYGMGVVIINAAQFYNSRPAALYAAVIISGAVGLCFYGLVSLAERLILRERRLQS